MNFDNTQACSCMLKLASSRHIGPKLNAICQSYISLFPITDGVLRNFEKNENHLFFVEPILKCKKKKNELK